MKNPKRWMYILVCIAAVVAIGVGGYRYAWECSFLETALPADAFVEDIVQTPDADGNKQTVVTVWYLTGDNQEQVCALAGYTPSMKDAEGKIRVWYQPEQPEYCYAKGAAGYESLFWIGGTLAVVAAVWGIWRNPFKKPAATKQ